MHKILLPIILIAIFIAGFLFVKGNLENLKIPTSIKEIVVSKTGCDDECKKSIQEEVEKAIAKIPTTLPKSVVTQRPDINLRTQIIPLGGSYSTIAAAWVDVSGSEVTFNVEKDYGGKAAVSFHASLKIADGNGQTLARLYDSTHAMAVFGSEISTANNLDYQSVSSGNLSLWSGYNTYKVQIKSPNSKEVSYTGGGIKISY